MFFFGIIVSDRLYKKVRQSATVAVCEVMTLYLERNVYISVVVVVVSIVGVEAFSIFALSVSLSALELVVSKFT